MHIPELGVGIIYFPGFESVLESNLDLLQVIEIEPQTFWYKNKSSLDSFTIDQHQLAYLRSFQLPFLFHGVGSPVGGSIPPLAAHTLCLREMINQMSPVWLSEHLSFNTFDEGGQPTNTNFLLPPLQTKEGVAIASQTIRDYAANFTIPFAFETGVNYLSPYTFELPDGEFLATIAQQSDAYILLDLHNLLANHKNGRQDIYTLLNQLDLSRVIQIHLAGGFYYQEYYLDAHSSVSSEEVLEVFEYTVERLPNVKAITFEMQAAYLPSVSAKALRQQLQRMNRVWDQRGRQYKSDTLTTATSVASSDQQFSAAPVSVITWENTLGLLAIGKEITVKNALYEKLKQDPGIEIIRALVNTFRKSQLISSLRLTCRYILLKQGEEAFEQIVCHFWSQSAPQLFASDNGLAFATYLLQSELGGLADTVLADLILYERASLRTLLDGETRKVTLSFNPLEVAASLGTGELPTCTDIGQYQVKITPPTHDPPETIAIVVHE